MSEYVRTRADGQASPAPGTYLPREDLTISVATTVAAPNRDAPNQKTAGNPKVLTAAATASEEDARSPTQ